MTTAYPETSVPAPPTRSNRINLHQEFDVEGCPYSVTVTSTPNMIDTVTVDLAGMGPDGEATTGHFTVHISALPHLRRVLASTFNGLAVLHNAVAPPRPARERRRTARKPGNSHQPWTPDLDSRLTQAWQAVDPTRPPIEAATALALALAVDIADVTKQFEHPDAIHSPQHVIGAIAKLMGRTSVAISSRLERLQLDPGTPGRESEASSLSVPRDVRSEQEPDQHIDNQVQAVGQRVARS
ncbi:hypothetical protein [Umezawaea sp. Da 62-37]|uniref:hypothetical protein n=1 Tax=Umezawaea sp. Da 62-37 TaxID=3075927 RepID=UPI0028F6DB74|nr:hypothetical protein [Umezawaea sp. Da 62-37]WNV85066.1 hypothetical protein RM788_44125 [Umezawaea sp. Da 62-37]